MGSSRCCEWEPTGDEPWNQDQAGHCQVLCIPSAEAC